MSRFLVNRSIFRSNSRMVLFSMFENMCKFHGVHPNGYVWSIQWTPQKIITLNPALRVLERYVSQSIYRVGPGHAHAVYSPLWDPTAATRRSTKNNLSIFCNDDADQRNTYRKNTSKPWAKLTVYWAKLSTFNVFNMKNHQNIPSRIIHHIIKPIH